MREWKGQVESWTMLDMNFCQCNLFTSMVQFQDQDEGRGLETPQQGQAPFQQILNRRIPRSDSPTEEKGSDGNDWSEDEEVKILKLQNPTAGSSNLKHGRDESIIPKDTKLELSTHKQSKDEMVNKQVSILISIDLLLKSFKGKTK